jgi:hypothetical protein
VCRRFASAADWLSNRARSRRPLSRNRISSEQSLCRASARFAFKRKHLCHGGRPLPDGCGVFCRDSRETDAKRKFQDLLQTGAQTFGIVRVQRARRSHNSFDWWWWRPVCRIPDGLLVRIRSCLRLSPGLCASNSPHTRLHSAARRGCAEIFRARNQRTRLLHRKSSVWMIRERLIPIRG